MPQVQHFGTIYKSIWDAMDLKDRAQGFVINNLTPAANAAGTLVVSVSSGTFVANSAAAGTSYAGGTIALTAADATNPRVDIIYFNTAGALAKSDGTPASANPVPASWPASVCPIAICFVPAGATDFTTGGYVADTRFFKQFGAVGGTPAVHMASAAAAGTASTFMRTDDTFQAFDTNFPAAVTLGGASNAGTASFAARSNHGHEQTFIGCYLTMSSNQTIASNATTAVSFNGERFDTDTMHNSTASTTKIKFRTPGKYNLGFNCEIDNSNFQIFTQIRLNGTTVIAQSYYNITGGVNIQGAYIGTMRDFVSTDYVEATVQNIGTSVVSVGGSGVAAYTPVFWAHKVG